MNPMTTSLENAVAGKITRRKPQRTSSGQTALRGLPTTTPSGYTGGTSGYVGAGAPAASHFGTARFGGNTYTGIAPGHTVTYGLGKPKTAAQMGPGEYTNGRTGGTYISSNGPPGTIYQNAGNVDMATGLGIGAQEASRQLAANIATRKTIANAMQAASAFAAMGSLR